MIKTLLKQLIIEECINTLFSNIHKNLNQNYNNNSNIKFQHKIVDNHLRSLLFFIHKNTERLVKCYDELGYKGMNKNKLIQYHEEILIDQMNNHINYLNRVKPYVKKLQ